MTEILLVIPLVLINLGLIVWALIDMANRKRVRWGTKVPWVFIIILFGYIGPLVYLLFGRLEHEA